MTIKNDELSLQDLNQLLVDLGIEEGPNRAPPSSKKINLVTLPPEPIKLDPPPYPTKTRNLLIPIGLFTLFTAGFFIGLAFSSTLSLMHRAIALEEKIESRLDNIERSLLPPKTNEMKPSEIIEPLKENTDKILPKRIA